MALAFTNYLCNEKTNEAELPSVSIQLVFRTLFTFAVFLDPCLKTTKNILKL